MVRRGAWSEFLQGYCDCELEEILLAPRDVVQHTLLIDLCLLLDYDLQLCSALLSEPRTELSALNRAAVEAQHQLLSTYRQQDRPNVTSLSVKESVHVRLHNFPNIPELVRNRVPGCVDTDKYLIVNGTVIRTGNTKVLERVQMWRCSTCQGITETEGLLELRYKLTSPKKCSVESCKGYKFSHLQDENMRCTDYQEIKIQEKVERLDMGTIPRNMTAVLEYDLVDTCKAGDDVTIFGIVTQIWDSPVINTRCTVETVLHANYIQIHNEQRCSLDVTDNAISRHYAHWRRYKDRPMSGRNLLLASFCPDVYQLYIVKLAAFLVILGGVTHMDGRGSKVRGECHMLMVGDPGTGKSQILKYASKLSPRSVITTGIGCTKAGLTVAAVKEGGEWALEAGAMVLADGGVCCIDELSSIRETDRVAIHEAMEQQTISVAKAGLVCKLNTRTTVLAATNPRGSYDITQPISANVPIGTPLLSRFDLILVLFDDHTPTWDSLVAGYLLKEQAVIEENNILKNYTADTLWSFTELQQYVSHVKSLTPKLTKPAKEVLGRYYRLQREQISRNVSRTTIRMLESLVRLSQAHAKLMMHERVELEDALVTISLVECTMLNSSLLGSVSVLHSVFPAQPELEFDKQKTLVLEVLGLPPNYGESNEPAPQTLAPPRRGPVLETDDLDEVPSFHVNTQELRKELDRQEKKRVPIPTQFLINRDTNPESKVSQKIVHKPCEKARLLPPRHKHANLIQDASSVSSACSSASALPKKTSFAELVRNFKANKRARIATPTPESTNECDPTLDDVLNEDFSDILSPGPSDVLSHFNISYPTQSDTGTQAGPSKPKLTGRILLNTPSRSEKVLKLHILDNSAEDPLSGSDQMSTEDTERQNTPVTKMYAKFNSVSSQRPNREIGNEGAEKAEVSSFTPYVNTQSVGLMSSAKENLPPPPPHFNLSPVVIETLPGPCDVTLSPDDVTRDELAAKTTRLPEASLFHNKSAEKLKRFSYQPKRKL